MDYRMLIGVHRIPANTRQNLPKDPTSLEEDIVKSKSVREILFKKANMRGVTSTTPADESNSSFDDFDKFDPYLNEDDTSFLDGVNQNKNRTEIGPTTSINEMDIVVLKLKKEYATEQMYWPFHKYYDIQGNRRMCPSYTYQISSQIQIKSQQTSSDGNGLADVTCENGTDETKHSKAQKVQWDLSSFDVPISKQRDSGIYMDVSGETLSIEHSKHSGEIQLCEGKIFYMGIIDILQQFNIKKGLKPNTEGVEILYYLLN